MDAAWTICPHCELKHRPRAQSLCPRCGRTSAAAARTATPMATPVAVPRASPTPAAAAARTAELAPSLAPSLAAPALEYTPTPLEVARERLRAAQAADKKEAEPASTLVLGGGILLVNAVLHLFEFIVLPSVSSGGSLQAMLFAGTLVGVLVDTVLGLSFLRGQTHLRTVAVARLVVGMFVFGGISLYQAQLLSTLVVFAFSCGLLVLIHGKPSSTLAGVGLTAVLLGGAVEVLGFVKLASTQSLDERARMALRPDLEGRELTHEDTLIGQRRPYRLIVPSDGWFRHKAGSPGAPDAPADLWLSQPELNGHLTVAVREDPSGHVDLREAREQALSELRTKYPDFQEAEPIAPTAAPGLAFSGRATREGQPFLFEVSLFATGGSLLRVTALAPAPVFERLHLSGTTATLRPD